MEEKEKTFVLDYDPAPEVPEEKPLLKVVAEALDESGRLPEGFSLPEKNISSMFCATLRPRSRNRQYIGIPPRIM